MSRQLTELEPYFINAAPNADSVARNLDIVGRETLRRSRWTTSPDFDVFHPEDLGNLFELYDEHVFGGRCRQLLGTTPLKFRISGRMTSAGGKTTRFSRRGVPGSEFYEITVAGSLLYDSFDKESRQIRVCGCECRTTLEALQRIMEHEITHLIELLLWRVSSCAQSRFQSISRRFFGHLDYRHALITPREQARDVGIRVGVPVRFTYDGRTFTGIVNRVTKRATVLVEDPRGRPFSDGKRYQIYYIPIQQLEMIGR